MAFRRRLLILLLTTAAVLAVVWARMFQLQVVAGEDYRRRAEASTRRTEWVLGPRGRILDAKGEPLALDQSVVQLVFSPAEWATRERFRCRRCGTMLFARSPRYFDRAEQPVVPPKSCTCGAKRDELEPVAADDMEPLETVLNLPPGTLASAADDRMEAIGRTIEIVTTDRVLGLEKGVKARARDLERTMQAGPDAGGRSDRAKDLAVDRVLAELAPELLEHAFEVDDVRSEQRSDRFARPVVMTEFPVPNRPAIQLKKLSPEAERLLELDRDGRYRGFRAELARERWYPQERLLPQLIGITGAFGSAEEIRSFRARYGAETVLEDTRLGRMGLEARYDEELRGLPGIVAREKDASGAFSGVRVVRAPVHGKDVRLHLDLAACREAQHILLDVATDAGYAGEGQASAGFVAMEAETGHIVAWAEAPVFDLNGDRSVFSKRVENEKGESRTVVDGAATADPSNDPAFFVARAVRPAPVLSRVARIAVEPGSSFKILTALSLLDAGHAPENYVCIGAKHGDRDRLPFCHHHDDEGFDLVHMLIVSCNRYCADASSDRAWFAVHREVFPRWAISCGFGRPSGVDFPSASSGAYPEELGADKIRQVAIGQSVTATPLQMARLAALIANGHFLPFPRLAADVDGTAVRDGGVEVEIAPQALAKVRAGLRGCVEQGTAKGVFEADPALAGVTVYGKTGTASVTGPDWASDDPEDAGETKPHHLWFVGYAVKPGLPTIAFACVLHARKEHEGEAGKVAAPVVARFLHHWYTR